MLTMLPSQGPQRDCCTTAYMAGFAVPSPIRDQRVAALFSIHDAIDPLGAAMAIIFLDPVTGQLRRIQTSPATVKLSGGLPDTLPATQERKTEASVSREQSIPTVRHFTGDKACPRVVAARL